MAVSLNTNVSSLVTQQNQVRANEKMDKSLARLALGKRIASAADDAAGLFISNNATAQIRGLNQAGRNLNDGISQTQVASGALQATTDAVQRINELSGQAANSTLTDADRSAIQVEINQLVSEVDRIADQTAFNGQNLLDGSAGEQTLQAGANEGETVTYTIGAANAATLGLDTIDVTTQSGAEAAITSSGNALNTISNIQAGLGAIENRFESAINNLAGQEENVAAARSRLLDVDVAFEASNLIRNDIGSQAATAILGQANTSAQAALSLLG